MALPAILQGDSLTRLLQGAVAGVVATVVIGFNWGGWVTGGTAKEMAQKSASTALVSALSPICVDKFQHSADAAANLVELSKVSSWQQSSFIEKGAAGRRCPAVSQQMRPLRRPAPQCSAVFKSNLANAASAVVDCGVSVGWSAQMRRRTP